MRVIEVNNVSEALPQGLGLLLDHGVEEQSRAGPVVVAPWPVATAYARPCERVLFSARRDANPFFHLVEAMWMLAGRNDAPLLDRYVKDFSVRFAEESGLVHGTYGARWRGHFCTDGDEPIDQLDAVVEILKKDSTSRQAVLTMWDPVADLGRADLPQWKDRPCNTHAYLRVRSDPTFHWNRGNRHLLDMTVCCRSNDIIWGAYGANAVHLSVLQEYLAARVGVGVGTYVQVSHNFHAYRSEIDRLRSRLEPGASLCASLSDLRYGVWLGGNQELVTPEPLVDDPATFDDELGFVLRWIDRDCQGDLRGVKLKNDFLWSTVMTAALAHAQFKMDAVSAAQTTAKTIVAPDWRAACLEWLERRAQRRAA